MKKIKTYNTFIKESPDSIMRGYYSIYTHEDDDAIPFGYNKDGIMLVSKSAKNHLKLSEIFGLCDKNNNSEIKNVIELHCFVYPGRIWYLKKIISFWDYPPANKMKKVLYDLQKALKKINIDITIDDTWEIDIPTLSKFSNNEMEGIRVKINDYIEKNENPQSKFGISSWEEFVNFRKELKKYKINEEMDTEEILTRLSTEENEMVAEWLSEKLKMEIVYKKYFYIKYWVIESPNIKTFMKAKYSPFYSREHAEKYIELLKKEEFSMCTREYVVELHTAIINYFLKFIESNGIKSEFEEFLYKINTL